MEGTENYGQGRILRNHQRALLPLLELRTLCPIPHICGHTARLRFVLVPAASHGFRVLGCQQLVSS